MKNREDAIRQRQALATLTITAAVLLAGCAFTSSSGPTPTPSATATVTPSPTPTLSPTPRPTSTPLPTPVPVPPSGSVRSRLFVDCIEGTYGLEVRVIYGATILNTDDPRATVTRIRLYRDGLPLEDTGPLSNRIYVREITFDALSNRVYTVQMHVETWAAPQPADLVQFTRCPPSSSEPLAQSAILDT